MKMFKRVLAAGAALMMAVTGMAMSASAANWSVYFNPASPYGMKFTDDTNLGYRTTQSTSFWDTCSSFSQTTNGANVSATVNYNVYYYDNSGKVKYCLINDLVYNGTSSKHSVPLDYYIPSYKDIYVMHHLNGNGNIASMSGSSQKQN